MKIYKPPQRLTDLYYVLSYCSKSIFNKSERFLINQERAKLTAGNNEYKQPDYLEQKIKDTLKELIKANYQPEINIYK